MAIGKGKNCPKLKILALLKSAYQKFSENALSKLKIPFCEIYYIKQDTLLQILLFTTVKLDFKRIFGHSIFVA